MARCPTCHRRLAPTARWPQDGGSSPLPDAAAGDTAPPAAPSVPGYTITGLLGTGGFGSVWEARDESTGQQVALKVGHSTDTSSILRLGREADALARVGEP